MWPPSSHERTSRSDGSGSASTTPPNRPGTAAVGSSLRPCGAGGGRGSPPAPRPRASRAGRSRTPPHGPRATAVPVGEPTIGRDGERPSSRACQSGTTRPGESEGRGGPAPIAGRLSPRSRATSVAQTCLQGVVSNLRAGAGQGDAPAPARDVDAVGPRAPDGGLGPVRAGPQEAHAPQGLVVLPALPGVAVELGREAVGPEHETVMLARRGGGERQEQLAPQAYSCYAYLMASRTTLILDDEARAAARQLARRYGCSLSEAMRRALVRQRDAEVGVPRERRRERSRALRRLISLFRATTRLPRSGGSGGSRGLLVRYRLDTDFLVYALSVAGPERKQLRDLADSDAEIQMSAVAWYEFSGGLARPSSSPWLAPSSARTACSPSPRPRQRRRQTSSGGSALPASGRGRAIGVTAAIQQAVLLTRNARDFSGIPGLRTATASRA